MDFTTISLKSQFRKQISYCPDVCDQARIFLYENGVKSDFERYYAENNAKLQAMQNRLTVTYVLKTAWVANIEIYGTSLVLYDMPNTR